QVCDGTVLLQPGVVQIKTVFHADEVGNLSRIDRARSLAHVYAFRDGRDVGNEIGHRFFGEWRGRVGRDPGRAEEAARNPQCRAIFRDPLVVGEPVGPDSAERHIALRPLDDSSVGHQTRVTFCTGVQIDLDLAFFANDITIVWNDAVRISLD